VQGDRHKVMTSDDWALTVEHLPSLNAAAKKKYPVLICHGLGANREYFKAKSEDATHAWFFGKRGAVAGLDFAHVLSVALAHVRHSQRESLWVPGILAVFSFPAVIP